MPSKGGIEVLGVLQGRLFKAEPTKSWAPLGTGDVELTIVQKKGEPFLTFFLTVGSNGVEVRRSTTSGYAPLFQLFVLCVLYFLLIKLPDSFMGCLSGVRRYCGILLILSVLIFT